MPSNHKYPVEWRGIDRGREKHLEPSHWFGVLEILSRHDLADMRNPKDPMYQDLKSAFPETVWISEHDKKHNFFRDYQGAWTLTGVLEPTRNTGGKISLTKNGRLLARGLLSQRAVMVQAMARYEEDNGEHSFAILASAFLALNDQSLTISQIYFGIQLNWRPGDGIPVVAPYKSTKKNTIPDTPRRRLRAILKLMTSYGALICIDDEWSVNDRGLLEAIAKGADLPEPEEPEDIEEEPEDYDEESVISEIEKELQDAILGSKDASENVRKKVLREIAVRQGQAAFRKQLLSLYRGRCAITKWDTPLTLEAAHVVPVADEGSNEVTNGILLRSDIHTLFDLNCIGIDPENWHVRVAPCIGSSKYASLEGTEIRLPISVADYPSRHRLSEHLSKVLEN